MVSVGCNSLKSHLKNMSRLTPCSDIHQNDQIDKQLHHLIASYSTATHSISTSVPIGKVLTATHLRFKSAHQISPHSSHHNSRPARLHVPPISFVHLIHLCKIIHTSQEHVHFDDFVDIRACFFENSSEVLDALMLWCVSVVLLPMRDQDSKYVQCELQCLRQ